MTDTGGIDLEEIEEQAAENLDEHAGEVGSDDIKGDLETGSGAGDDGHSEIRLAVAVAFPVLAAALLVGGVFIGFEPRVYAALGGLLGIGLALLIRRLPGAVVANVTMVLGLFAIGLVVVLPTGPGNVTGIASRVSEASETGDLLRPPVPFVAGWQAIVGWLMGIVGFAAAWIAVELRRPALGLLVPLPIAAIAAISVPESQRVASGLAAFALFAVSLGLLSSASTAAEGEEVSAAYEVRKAVRSLPLIGAITVGMFFLAQTDFLFPDPVIDPTQEPQKPKTTPLSDVEDRVLFEVESGITGPWRIGSLDVYDGTDWRLPPFADNELEEVDESGIVDEDLDQGVKARFIIAGLEGVVLPALPNTVGIVAEGPTLDYDARNANIRVSQGAVQAGLAYTVTAAALPNIDDLRAVTEGTPENLRKFTDIPPPPPGIEELIGEAKAKHTNRWDRFDFLRTYVLENVVATGTGQPISVPPGRAEDILTVSFEASPYEIVAVQAMLARWVDVPSRIGYGFDCGTTACEVVDGRQQVRPRHGASFVEVYFPGFKWLPVIGTPKKAKPTVGADASTQQFNSDVLPSDDVTVQVFLPVLVSPASVFGETVRNMLMVVVPLLLLAAVTYFVWPLFRKSWIRSKRRTAAASAGPRARLALAYAEWRDHAADFGFAHHSDTPLQYLDRFAPDAEHNELAWLVTRGLWGDMQHDLTDDHAATAEEISRALRRRLSLAQPGTVRFVAAVARTSLRDPYAVETDLRPGAQRAFERRAGRVDGRRPRRPFRKERADVAAAT